MPSRLTLMTAAFLAALVAQGATAVGGGLAPAPGGPARAAKARPRATDLKRSKDLWATVNICDTARHPNTIGVRGSMPGLGNRRSRMAMRFRVQYKSRTDGKWKDTGGKTSDSGWIRVGSTIRLVSSYGRDFTFKPPTDGGSHLLRGVVSFRWKRQGRVVARARRVTRRGHRTGVGDPKDYTAAQCEITAP